MGYCMHQRDCNFFIDGQNFDKALAAIKSLAGHETIEDSSGKHFSWVDTCDFMSARSLEDALGVWRWRVRMGPLRNHSIIAIHFEGEKLGDDFIILQAIAPFVEGGSFIEMQGEDGTVWRWVFENGSVKEKIGKIVFN